MYEVGFKDIYPWVWSVVLGVALTLAERRGASHATGTRSTGEFWVENVLAVLINLVLPAIIFALTMVRVGPQYAGNMDFFQV
jgi:hypothetical protein